VALAAVKGEKTLGELTQLDDVHANQITIWRTQLLEGAAGVFGADSVSDRREDVARQDRRVDANVLLGVNDYLTGALGPNFQDRPGLLTGAKR